MIVLAAGLGSRFMAPEHKLSQTFGGRTVLGMTLDHALDSGLPVAVVTRRALAPLTNSRAGRFEPVLLPDDGASQPGFGIGHSIAAGVAACGSAPGWVILPADMPLVQPHTIRRVAQALDAAPAAYAQHRGRRGHPVAFAAELYSELARLSGDEGARRLLARYPSQAVEIDDPGVLIDIDTEQDLLAARERLASA